MTAKEAKWSIQCIHGLRVMQRRVAAARVPCVRPCRSVHVTAECMQRTVVATECAHTVSPHSLCAVNHTRAHYILTLVIIVIIALAYQ